MPRKSSPGPSVKDPDRYEALRHDGASKEKAARIANSDPHRTGVRGGQAPPYEEWSKADLYDRAKDIGIDGRSKLDKEGLIDALRNH
jgi:hypothetical protein